MRVETATTYRCDGCSKTEQNPYGWQTVMGLSVSGMFQTGHNPGADFCSDCWRFMLKSLHERAKA